MGPREGHRLWQLRGDSVTLTSPIMMLYSALGGPTAADSDVLLE